MQENDHSDSRTTALGAARPSVTVHPGHVVMYQITEQDLDFFASGMRSIFTGLASSCVTVGISVGLLLALNSGINQQLQVGMLSTTIAAPVLGVAFGALAAKEFWSYKRKLSDIKRKALPQSSATPEYKPSTSVGRGLRRVSMPGVRRPGPR